MIFQFLMKIRLMTNSCCKVILKTTGLCWLASLVHIFCKLSLGYNRASFVDVESFLCKMQWEKSSVLTRSRLSWYIHAVCLPKCTYCLIIFCLFFSSWYAMKSKCSTHIDVRLCQQSIHSVQDELVCVVYCDFVSCRR